MGPTSSFLVACTSTDRWSHDRKGASAPLLPTTPEDWCGDIRFPDAQSRKLAHWGEVAPRPSTQAVENSLATNPSFSSPQSVLWKFWV